MDNPNLIKYSVVVPLFNEEENAAELHRRILAASRQLKDPTEIIFIDDGSTDQTAVVCTSLAPLVFIQLRKNFGQTAAFDAGFKTARGQIIFTLDGDLQNDPADFPLLLAELERGFDAVSGWRHNRQDTAGKKISSRGANFLRKLLFRDSIHDSGCALKCYRRECLEDLDLYGEMHRFIPALLETRGFRVGEVKVHHNPRLFGHTKYNWRRYLKSLVDMTAIWFWANFSARPLHFLGGLGFVHAVVGSIILAVLAISRIFFLVQLSDRIWPLVGIFLILAGIQLFTIGILSDILIKIYFRGHNRMNYSIRNISTKS